MGEITEISSRYVDEHARLDPMRAIRLMGIVDEDGRLTDFSPEGTAATADLLRRTLTELDRAEPVDEIERLGKLFLHGQLGGDLGTIDAGERELTMTAGSGPQSMIRMAFDLVPHDTDDDWARVAKMLRNVPGALAGYRSTLQHGIAAGRIAPKLTTTGVIEQCETWSRGWFEDHVETYGDGPLKGELGAAAADACSAYAALADWLQTEYLPVAVDELGVGAERYALWQRAMLGIELDVDEAYAWGWEELERIEAEQRRECERIRPGASFAEVRELLDSDPARAVHSVEEYREWLQEISDAATAKLNGWQFDIPEPLLRCEIGIPPPGSAAAAYYTPPSEDLSRPGRTWFPTVGRTTIPKWDQVTIAYHEAVPGHHLQMGGIRMLPLTRAHKLGFNSAHGEGWALYAERLMDELGELGTPDVRLGFLASQAFRAARVVVDIGLHTGRALPDGRTWTPDVAKEHLGRSSGMTDAFLDSEVARYVAWPAQATTYKLGERTWLAGRDAARAAQGASFDLKRWHAAALALGALGLGDLERELATAGRA